MIAWRIRRLPVVISTNDEAREAAQKSEHEGLVIQAMRQTGGRGRQGRVWESPEGNLYCSILLRPFCEARWYGHYGFAAALAIYDTLKEFLPESDVKLKWPNDVLVNGKKISGLLLEVEDTALIVGIGLNVAHHPAEALYPCTSLRAEGGGADIKADKVLKKLLGHFGLWLERVEQDGRETLRLMWQERAQKGCLTVGRSGEKITGDFAGLDENGHLRLTLADGTERLVPTGDVLGE